MDFWKRYVRSIKQGIDRVKEKVKVKKNLVKALKSN